MLVTLIVVGVLFVGWILVNLKTSRSDGVLVRGVHPYRTMMWYIMPTRNESVVYYDTYVKADKLLAYVEAGKATGVDLDISHCLVGAVAVGLAENPKMNRFVVGHRLYDRKGRVITFSMKRKRLDREAKLSMVKLRMEDGESFGDLCRRINGNITVERSDAVTSTDKEYNLLTAIPRPLLRLGVRFFRWLDYHNLLPASFIEGDGMYCSVFIANLGSLGMRPGYHHLFEWGTAGHFLMAGQIEKQRTVDGELEHRLHLRWSYDERIDDGLTARFGIASVVRALEDPELYFDRLDGAKRPMGRPAQAPASPVAAG